MKNSEEERAVEKVGCRVGIGTLRSKSARREKGVLREKARCRRGNKGYWGKSAAGMQLLVGKETLGGVGC